MSMYMCSISLSWTRTVDDHSPLLTVIHGIENGKPNDPWGSTFLTLKAESRVVIVIKAPGNV